MKLIRFYVGTERDKNGAPITAYMAANNDLTVFKRFTEHFGGVSRFSCYGGWIDPRTKELVQEISYVYEVAINHDIDVKHYRDWLALLWNQSEVMTKVIPCESYE